MSSDDGSYHTEEEPDSEVISSEEEEGGEIEVNHGIRYMIRYTSQRFYESINLLLY